MKKQNSLELAIGQRWIYEENEKWYVEIVHVYDTVWGKVGLGINDFDSRPELWTVAKLEQKGYELVCEEGLCPMDVKKNEPVYVWHGDADAEYREIRHATGQYNDFGFILCYTLGHTSYTTEDRPMEWHKWKRVEVEND